MGQQQINDGGVRAVLDRLCMLATDKGAGGHEAREARAAVAELAEAARPLASPAHDGSLMAMLVKGLNAHDAASFREAVARLDAALARFGGAE